MAGIPLAGLSLAACGSAGPGSSSASTGATYWSLTGQPQEGIRQATVERFNAANPDSTIATTVFQNDAYKTKIKTALGAGEAPTIIYGWGGGGLRTYVQADQVEDLTDWFAQDPQLKDRLFASSFAAATVDQKIYAVPCEAVAPIVLFYNKALFAKVGVQPPKTWDEVLALVPAFNSQGIAPFSLGGQSRWTNMMWLEFLFDRIGGPELFESIYAGNKDAWNAPASLQALSEVQKLVKANGFIKGFSSITADSNADQALLYSDKAAMMLHGAWTYAQMKDSAPDFVAKDLGFVNFPTVTGGKGDPSNTVGNPGQYLSISAKASDTEKDVAKKFLSTTLLDTTEQKAWIDSGNIPVVNGSDSLIGDSPDAAWLQFVYQTSSQASTFVQSWDQALSPASAEVLLDNIAKLFQLSISPEQFATSMNAVLGQ
ncbi:extracellular solute-binding protein [Kineosporia babensis]|uniref:Extracellular solute-binding protein n=1 Tax=Kineosporia babensis TaxID=499548 RepID=A0A9X1NN54_9ACTN|nr:extracellular solute-binding protein [Kineosporia babensis]MCD5317180.1 extracellular solute-binding protein [Kineosporia babensis]